LARTDEGEFELVLGNRQLISVFLIVVILLGVFFSMGYIVGRNSSGGSSTDLARNGTGKAIVVERPSPAGSLPPETPVPPTEVKPEPSHPETTHAEQPKLTHAEQPKPSPMATAPEPPKEKPKETKPPEPARTSVTGEPAPGNYWQVVATSRPDAELISEALNKKGFHALVAPGPRDNVFRVLVGPLKDSAAQAQARSDLEASGFKNPIVRKY
jgi:cell division septation protein DedD